MLRTKRHDDTPAAVATLAHMIGALVVRKQLGVYVKPAGSREGFSPRQEDHLIVLAADAGLEQLLPPFGLAQRFPSAADLGLRM
jgi:hypothetical protein